MAKKHYYLTIDTETANTTDDALVYDIGGCIHDRQGNVYETFSFVVYETFVLCKDLMQSAYYANKIPKYNEELKNGTRVMKRFFNIKKYIKELCDTYNVKAIIAHYANFDYRALNTSARYISSSKVRYFLPYGIEIWDTLKMANDTIGKLKKYQKFCFDNGFITNHKNPRPQLKAEILYRFITNNLDFEESHTGLEDVLIEKEIFVYCNKMHKKMRRKLFEK